MRLGGGGGGGGATNSSGLTRPMLSLDGDLGLLTGEWSGDVRSSGSSSYIGSCNGDKGRSSSPTSKTSGGTSPTACVSACLLRSQFLRKTFPQELHS